MTPRPFSLRPGQPPAVGELPADLWRALADVVLETTISGVWLIDSQQRTTYVNEHMAAMLGWPASDMIGSDLLSFMDDEGREICNRNLARRKSGISEQHEFKFIRKDGSAVWALLATNPVYDQQGKYAGALALADDITESKLRALAVESELDALRARAWRSERATLPPDCVLAPTELRARLIAECARALRRKPRSSLLAIGASGHPRPASDAAEAMLQQVLVGLHTPGATGKALLSDCDSVGRHAPGGLLVLLPEVGLREAHELAERILELPRPDRAVGVVIGVASLGPHGDEADGLIQGAHDAMVRAASTRAPRVGLADFV